MEVHSRSAVSPLRHDAWDERNVFQVKLVRHPLHRDGFDERIGDDDLLDTQRGRVTVVGCFRISLEQLADPRKVGQKIHRQGVGQGAQFLFRDAFGRGVLEAFVDLVLQPAQNGIHQGGNFHPQLGGMDRFLIEETRENQAEQIECDGGNRTFGGKILSVEMVDAAAAGVGGNQLIGQLRHVHAASIPQRVGKGKRVEGSNS